MIDHFQIQYLNTTWIFGNVLIKSGDKKVSVVVYLGTVSIKSSRSFCWVFIEY